MAPDKREGTTYSVLQNFIRENETLFSEKLAKTTELTRMMF